LEEYRNFGIGNDCPQVLIDRNIDIRDPKLLKNYKKNVPKTGKNFWQLCHFFGTKCKNRRNDPANFCEKMNFVPLFWHNVPVLKSLEPLIYKGLCQKTRNLPKKILSKNTHKKCV